MKSLTTLPLRFLFRVVGWFCFFVGTMNPARVLLHPPEVSDPVINIWICFVSSVAMTIWWYSITFNDSRKEATK